MQLQTGMVALEDSLADQAEFSHQYWSAAAEDIVSSSRDWAAVHSAIRSAAGMKEMEVPLTLKFSQ